MRQLAQLLHFLVARQPTNFSALEADISNPLMPADQSQKHGAQMP